MNEYEDENLSPDEERVANALRVVPDGQRSLLDVGGRQVLLPSVKSSPEEMDRFNKFLTQTGLGAIERKKQKRTRQICADAELEILRLRTEAIVKAHQGLANEALAEIVIAANQYGRQALRRDELAEQQNVQRAILQAALQYTAFIRDMPDNLPEDVRNDVLRNALEVYQKTLDRIRGTDFRVDVS